jgi:hypothetical protein
LILEGVSRQQNTLVLLETVAAMVAGLPTAAAVYTLEFRIPVLGTFTVHLRRSA